jgi:hypothetical protein
VAIVDLGQMLLDVTHRLTVSTQMEDDPAQEELQDGYWPWTWMHAFDDHLPKSSHTMSKELLTLMPLWYTILLGLTTKSTDMICDVI